MTGATLPSTGGTWLDRVRQRAFRRAPGDGEPVVLRHSRIYILPTRAGLLVMGTVGAMLLTSLNYGLSLGFAVSFLLTGMVGAALLHTFRNLAGVEVAPQSAGDTFAGGKLAFTLALDGHGVARSALRISCEDGAAAIQDLPVGTRLPVTLEVPASTRGRRALGRVTLASRYPLGLWRAWSYVHFPLEGVVYPAPEPGAPPVPLGTLGNEAGTSGRAEDADLAGLREYQPGDPLQRVAWKAVARGAGWYTKAFEGAGGGGPVVLDWAATPPALDTETRLSRLTAWALACEHAARPFGLRLPEHSLAPGQSREHRRDVLRALALHEERVA
jgi:uncharacterized protein (DUF58 family)